MSKHDFKNPPWWIGKVSIFTIIMFISGIIQFIMCLTSNYVIAANWWMVVGTLVMASFMFFVDTRGE